MHAKRAEVYPERGGGVSQEGRGCIYIVYLLVLHKITMDPSHDFTSFREAHVFHSVS